MLKHVTLLACLQCLVDLDGLYSGLTTDICANSIFGELGSQKSIEKTSARNGRFRGRAQSAGYALQ